ncbi:MAG: aminotransferase class V-fold PLP-dependent enzyme [Acidimicrobiia bacterium]|nr:aminotransferase class V-fold PLP-dependent enzyme [Acidimicrobiia bacterium]
MSLPAEYLAEFSEPAGYLEFASIGPLSRHVQTEIADAYAAVAEPTGTVAPPMVERWMTARDAMGRLLGVPADRCTGTHNTSVGLFQTAFGLLSRGGNVVVPSHEFPANLYPWLRAESVGGPTVRLVDIPDHRVTAAALADAVDDETVGIAVSLVDFRTGFRLDVESLRELSPSALLIVDAIQGLGAVRFEMGSADVVVAGGQKWMRAGWGSGVHAVSERAQDLLEPTLTGWYGVEGFLDTAVPAPHPPRPDADQFHEGSPAIFGGYAFGAAIEVIEMAGIDLIEKTILDTSREFESALRAAGAEMVSPWRNDSERAGILSFRMPGHDQSAVASHLHDRGVIVSERAGWLRAAPHASTGRDTVPMLVDAIAEFVRSVA